MGGAGLWLRVTTMAMGFVVILIHKCITGLVT